MIENRQEIRVRIAPSPTGMLHVGTAHTALFNFLFARKNQGKLLLRIEDTDKKRSKQIFEEDIVSGLHWLGIEWDEEIEHQSNRFDIYKKYLLQLISAGHAFFCPHSEKELEQERGEQMKNKMSPHHVCDARDKGLDEGVVRFKNNKKGSIVFHDLIRGEVGFESELIGDFSIARNIDSALYHFAVVVDDFEKNISHIIRGDDHIANTPKQILIQEALGVQSPQYAHIPLLLGTDRSKLSKRHGATSINEYRNEGYLPEAMVNYLALLGWNSGTDQEIYLLDELIKDFSLERVQKAGAIFDIQKLDWMNGEYVRQKTPQELKNLLSPYIHDLISAKTIDIANEDKYIEQIVALEQPRLKKLSELSEKINYFFQEPHYDTSLLFWKFTSKEETMIALSRAQKIIESITGKDWNKENIEQLFLKEGESYKNRGELLWPLRVALSGKKASPGPFDILYILGEELAIRRIQKALAML